MDAEEVQELGRRGVAIIKRWLEATTYIELPFDVYNHTRECTVLHMTGQKKFDLKGFYLVGSKEAIYVESKRYGSPGKQYKEFQEFVAIAYSEALRSIRDYSRPSNTNFVWVTFHPFMLERWKHLETHEEIRKALEEHPRYLGGEQVDDDLIREVAKRVMVLVFNQKQESLSLTPKELQKIRVVVNRKADSL